MYCLVHDLKDFVCRYTQNEENWPDYQTRDCATGNRDLFPSEMYAIVPLLCNNLYVFSWNLRHNLSLLRRTNITNVPIFVLSTTIWALRRYTRDKRVTWQGKFPFSRVYVDRIVRYSFTTLSMYLLEGQAIVEFSGLNVISKCLHFYLHLMDSGFNWNFQSLLWCVFLKSKSE